ncbi:MAG: hypothetical protein U0350_06690 [Caldilineaceae bacterium]
MESNFALALFTKMKRLYESPEQADKFLVFPGAAMPISENSFDFVSDDGVLSDNEKDRLMIEFALQYNMIPEIKPLYSSNGTYLWEIYKQLFEPALVRVASGSGRTPTEEEEFQQAWSYLYQSDGSPSEVLLDYQYYQMVFKKALWAYNDAKIKFESTRENDPEYNEIKQRWLTTEPTLRLQKEEAEFNWNIKGHKSEVETTKTTYNLLNRQNPRQAWEEYKELFDAGKDQSRDPNLIMPFWQTSFSPAKFNEPTASWLRITLNNSEIQELCATAPQQLRGFKSSLRIEALSVEVAYVDIIRPWFKPELLNERYWQFIDQTRYLSNGAQQPEGLLPAYIQALIVGRNAELKLSSGSEIPVVEGQRLHNIIHWPQDLRLRPMDIDALGTNREAARDTQRTPRPIEPNEQLRRPAIVLRIVSPTYLKAFAIKRPMPNLFQMIIPFTGDQHSLKLPGPEVLALVCKRLSRSPNPDPALQW